MSSQIAVEAPPGRLRSVAESPWITFVLRRFVGLVAVLVLLVVAVFGMVQLIPGDPVRNSLGPDASPEAIVRIQQEQGFDDPLPTQLWHYFGDLLHGNLGHNWVTNESVSEIIRQRFWTSFELAAAALLIVMLVAVPLGMAAGALTREGRHPRLELGFTSATSVFSAIPDYLTATLLALVFAVWLRWFPVAGTGGFRTVVLPALAVSLGPMMALARLVRLETLNVLAQDYIRSARTQQLPARAIYGRQALPNVLTAALTVGGIVFANLIGGAVIVENVFARNGLGTALVNNVIAKQYVVVQGITLILGLMVVLMNTLVDVALVLVDPRSLTKRT